MVLFVFACGLAVCTAQLMNAAVTSTATAVNTATTATVTFTSTLGQNAAASNTVSLPCFSQECTCTGANNVAVAAPQVSWTSPTTSCPAAGTPSGSGSTFTVTNTNGPKLFATAPEFKVTATTTSAANSLTVDSAGAGVAPAALGGRKLALTLGQGTISAANLKSGAVTNAALVFNFVPTIPVPVNGKIIINLPFNYLEAQSLTATAVGTTTFGTCPVVNVAADSTACPTVSASATIVCTVGTADLPAQATALTFTSGWKSGDPGVTGGYTVVTTLANGNIIEGAFDTPSALQAFTKGVLTVAPTLVAATPGDLDAQIATTQGTLTLSFTSVNSVPAGGIFVLTTPLGYFRTLGFTSSGGTTGSGTATCVKTTTPATAPTNDVWTCTTTTAVTPANTAVTWVSAGGSWSVLNNQAAGVFSVKTQTAAGFDIDSAVTSAAGGAPAIVSAPGTIAVSAITTSSFGQATDVNPGLSPTTGTLTIAGIQSSITLGFGKSRLVFTFPYQYISATGAAYTVTGGLATTTGACTTSDTPPVAACPGKTGTAGFTTMTCTILTADLVAATAYSLILTAGQPWRIGTNTASGTFTLQAQSSNSGIVSVVSSPVSVAPVGSTVTSVAAATNTVPGDKLPGVTTTGTFTLGVTPASPLSIGSTIVFTLPANYFTGVGRILAGSTISTASAGVTCTLAQASPATACVAAGTTSTISCVTSGAVIPAAAVASVTFAIGSWSLAKGATGTYTATTYNNLNPRGLVDKESSSAALVSATASGSVSNVQAAVFSASTDQVPGLATTTGTLKFTFTTATTIPSGYISIQMQSKYLKTVGAFTTTAGSPSAPGPSGTCTISAEDDARCAVPASVETCGDSQDAKGAYQTLTCTFSSSLTAGVVTLSLTGGTYTVGSSQPASRYTVSIGTTVEIDAASTTFGTLPALSAGAVSSVATAAFSVSGDMVPGTTSTGTLTFGFNTATDLISGALILVELPSGYLSSVTNAKLGTATINCALSTLSQGCPVTTSQLMTCTTQGPVTKGAQSLVLQVGGFVVNTKNAAAGTSYRVSTSTSSGVVIDTPGSGQVPAITAGGSASGSGTAAASAPADLVPGTTTTGTLTLAFTIATTLPMTNGKIVFRLTPGYLRTAAAATLTGGTPATTSTCSSLSLNPGSAATGCSAAVWDTLTCTVGTANLNGGTYNLVLSSGQWSVSSAQAAGTFSVSTTNNNVVLDAASTTTGILPKIGSTVQVTSFTAQTATDLEKIEVASSGTLSIGFTTSTALVTNSFIRFTLPASNYFTTLTTATMTGQSTTAPTCVLEQSNSVVKCTFNANQPAGASTIILALGWKVGNTVNAAQFPANANFNKASYTISNLKTPAKYLAAATYSTTANTYKANYAANECSAALAFPQFGTAPPSPSNPTSPVKNSGMAMALSAAVALSCIVMFLL